MSSFTDLLKSTLALPHWKNNQASFALHAGLDKAHLSRVLSGKFSPTDDFVGRVCGAVKPRLGALFLKAYLDQKSQAVLSVARPPKGSPEWRSPGSMIAVEIACRPR
jgi:hypothetical protein